MIAIEGVMGSGKTTLQNDLKARTDASLVVQDFSHNICLKDYYKDESCVFQKQMIFLFSNYHVLMKAQKEFPHVLISDFCFERTAIISKMKMTNQEYTDMFLPCYSYLLSKLNPPHTIIFLHGQPKTIVNHIHDRNREMETSISPDYIEEIQSALLDNINQFKCSQLLLIDIDKYDIRSDDFQRDLILKLFR